MLSLIQTARRIARDYTAGVVNNAGRWYRIPVTTSRILRARLRSGVGPRHYSLFRLDRVPPAQWDNYLTDVPSFKRFLRAQSPQSMHRFANDKAVFHAHCSAAGLPTAPIVCIVGSGSEAYGGVPVVTGAGALAALLAAAPAALFAKQLNGTFGIGAFTIDRNGDGFGFDGRRGSATELFGLLCSGERAASQWLIQPRLTNHPDLRPLMSPHGLGTIRIVTCMDGGRARILYALHKLTVGDNTVDNFHGGSTGNLVASIDIATGRLGSARGSARTDWPAIRTVERHPETGRLISGFAVPLWRGVCDLVIRAQESVPALRSAGWDVAVTPDGPVLLEANLTYSTDIMQVAYNRGLKTELLAALQA